MAESGKEPRAVKILRAIATTSRDQEITGWCRNLANAEAAARQKALAADPEAKPFVYMINYRIDDAVSKTKQSRQHRYDALVAIIRSRKPAEAHTSTSTWAIKSYIPRAELLSGFLQPPLDPAIDGLHVARIVRSNVSHWGKTKLES